MKPIHYLLTLSLLALSACGGSHRPVYSGHQESTEGVPGFKNGKKVSQHVKLGQSYTVDGETYVPRHQPTYSEEGLASWYGPGFHGGKTANGERFDASEMTAAHRTLPLPSMVRVTMIETGRSAIVRVNDRGPFSKGRIIDLSRAAAEKIGLIGKGVGRVRVEYLDQESKRFTNLLADGRDPKSIDIEDEVLGGSTAGYATNDMRAQPEIYQSTKPSWASRMNPIASAKAQEYSAETNDSVDVMEVTATDLGAPSTPSASASSPFTVLESSPQATSEIAVVDRSVVQTIAPAALTTGGHYLQLGAFSQQANAERMRSKVTGIGASFIEPKTTAGANTLYVVRMGPYTTVEESTRVLAQLNGLGINPSTVSK